MVPPYTKIDRAIDDPTILQRIAAGETSAVEECLDEYGNIVWFLARKLSKTASDAEDAAQEIFVDIWKNAARFDPRIAPETAFIKLIAKRRLIDRQRGSCRRPQTRSFEDFSIEPATSEHQKLQMRLEARPAVIALRGLKLQQKQVIFLSIYEGMSHAEIAESTGLPLGTVKTSIRRGLQIMRSSLNFVTLSPAQS